MSKRSITYNRQKIQDCLSNAMRLAIKAHAGQTDRAGVPYINHVLEVASYGQTEVERITGLLHDIIEDGGYTKFELKEELGYPNRVVDAIDVLTKRKGEDYSSYIYRIFEHGELPSIVKMYDFISNCNPDRILEYTKDHDELSFTKYYRAASYLSQLYAKAAKINEWVGKDVKVVEFPHAMMNKYVFTMNMEKFIKQDFFNHPDYILTPRAIRRISSGEAVDEEVEASLELLVSRALCINPIENQPYVYIQVPAFVAAFNFEKLRKAVFEDSGQDLIIIRHSKYPVKGAYFNMVDVAIYNAGPIKIGSSNENHGYSKVNITPPWNKFKVDKSKKEKEFDELDLQEKMSEFAAGVVKDAKLGL